MALLPGCSGEQADAPSAYTQCELGAETPGVFPTTWITLPFEQWPKAWKDRKAKNPKFDPVCPLRLSLYGHPMAGVFWERHCQVKLKEAGFAPIPGWECLFVHWEPKCMLSVYVDDYKMAGVTQNLKKAWDAIRKSGIQIDEPTPFAHYLGCNQHPTKTTAEDVRKRLENISDLLPESPKGQPKPSAHAIKSIVYDMEGFIHQCVDRYCELAKIDKSTLKPVATPCLDDHQIDP